jgi:chromate transporter
MNTRHIGLSELFRGFATIGLLGFGGIAPIARHVIVEQYQWLSEKEYATVLGMGQVLPGANTINAAVMIGDQFQGLKGSIAAVAGLMVMPLLIVIILASIYNQFADHPLVSLTLNGAGAAAAGMVIGTGLKMAWRIHPGWTGWLTVALAVAGIALWGMPMLYVVALLVPLALLLTAYGRRS